ncbi:MAG: hypothetical protein M0Q49_01815 [Porticoccaceae bacterium]|nr:hypothetical protein [Porticoccaceae bacterium]
MKATFQNGNREVTATITSTSEWSKDTMKRVYFGLAFEGSKLDPIAKLYEVIEGGTRDATIEFAARTFGYQLGICCDSKTKRREAIEAIESLVAQITA